MIKDPGGCNACPGRAPSILGLGRITHPTPSLNTARAQNSQSMRGCQEAQGRDCPQWRTQWANEHTFLEHLHWGTRPSLGVPHPPGTPLVAARCSRRTQAAAPPFLQGGPSCASQMEKSLQKHHPYHIGKCSETSRISFPRDSPGSPSSWPRQWRLFWAAWGI